MKLIKIGDCYYNPKYITYIREIDKGDDEGKLVVGHVKSWGHTQNVSLEEILLRLEKEEEKK